MKKGFKAIFTIVVALLLGAGTQLSAQNATPTGKTTRVPPTIFRDSDGNLISNNEFVDIRMANYLVKDRTLVSTLEDGTIEFRLQKVPQEGAPAPLFSGKTVDGKPLRFESLVGNVVVLNFWFIGCPACRAEMPKLNELAGKFTGRDDVKFVSITADPVGEVRKYVKSNQFDYTLVADAQAALDMFGFAGYPKNIVIGRDGKIVYWRSTIAAWDKFESVVRAELEKK